MGKHKPRHQRRDLLQTIYANGPDLAASIRDFIATGVDINHVTEYSESPLRVVSNNGRFDVVKLLLDAGADSHQLGWSPSFFHIAFGKPKDIRASLAKHQDIEARDFWQRTPLLLAIQTGIVDKAELLLELGADPLVVGRSGKVPVEYAVQGNHCAMLEWLHDQGFDIEAEDDFGRTTNILDDGRIIEIGGEHEDSYDSDFCIYNDVTVFHPSGEIETYLYPENVFPPTDFHSATVVGGLIVIIGRLGYWGTRMPGTTPVHTLDLKSLRIDRVETSGDCPGWISAHRAQLDGESTIVVEEGQLENDSGSLYENTGRYRLSLVSWVWERVA
jgi:hypothetical protein